MPESRLQTRELNAIIKEVQKNSKTTTALVNTVSKQTVEINKSKATVQKKDSNLKGFLSKESDFLGKSFKFMKARKEGKESGKLRNVLNAKTMGPVLAKGLALGLLKFGIGGAIGASKAIDVIGNYQEFTKTNDEQMLETSLEQMQELRKQGKSDEEIQKTLAESNMKTRDIALTMEKFNDKMSELTKASIEQGVADGKSSNDIKDELVSLGLAKSKKVLTKEARVRAKLNDGGGAKSLLNEQKENNKITLERNDLENRRFEFEKQAEQNEQQRFLQSKVKADDDGGIFSSVLGMFKSFKGLKGLFATFVPMLGGLLTSLFPLLLVAGTAFAAFKVGGVISDGINGLTSWFTGKDGDTFGGWLQEALNPEDKEGRIKDKSVNGKSPLEIAREKGFTGPEENDAVLAFLTEHNNKQRSIIAMQQKDTAGQIGAINKQKAEEAQQASAGFAKGLSDEEAITQITSKLLKDMNINVNVPAGANSRLDNIPSNSDDVPLTYLAKAGAL